MPRSPRIVVIEPSGVRRDVPLNASPFRIGQQAGNELTLRDSRISCQQAQIISLNGGWVLEDMDSRHGTFVNGEKVLKHELQPRDKIDFGMADSYKLIYLGEGATIEELVEKVEGPAPSAPGSRELHHLGVLLDVARTLGTRISFEDVLTAVVDAAIQVTQTERGVLLLANPGGELQMVVARDTQKETLRPDLLKVSQSVVKRVVNTRREMIVSDTGDDAGGVSQQESVARPEPHTIVAIPVDKLPVIETLDATISTRQGELLGVLYMDSHIPSSAFTDMDRDMLRTLARDAATVIQNAKLFASARVKARREHEIEITRRAAYELEIAKQVQARLFPQTLPPLKTLEYAGVCIQARQVGGDYYDFLDLGRERLGLVISDIAGKGIAAALLMANLQANLRSQCAVALDQPQRFLRSVNQLFYENTTDGAYATLFFAEYADKERRLRYMNCGHLSGLLLRCDDSLERLDSTCTVVGLFKEWDCPIEERWLLSGDTLALYTDGITESCNDAGEEFGEHRLVEVLRRHREMASQSLLKAIVDEVRQFSPHEQHDDITLIVAKCR
jgi:serine phosphatase RsbU (regulator of sigma subunit)